MELRQLTAFVAVAEHLNFNRAAESLGVAQPAVSQAVRRLERALDAPLFERSSHHVALTAAGSILLPEARAVVETSARLRRLAVELPQGRHGVLRIATTSGIGPRLGDVIGRFAVAHPEIAFEFPVLDTAGKLMALREGQIELAFLRSGPPADPALPHAVAWRERYVAVVPARHPAAATDPVDVAALADLPMLAVDRATRPAMHDQLLETCRAIGLSPRPGPSVHTVQDTIAMVATGSAWTLYIEGNLPAEIPGVVTRRLPETAPTSAVHAVWRAVAMTAPAAAFLEFLAPGASPG